MVGLAGVGHHRNFGVDIVGQNGKCFIGVLKCFIGVVCCGECRGVLWPMQGGRCGWLD